jgi:hypothetical protein
MGAEVESINCGARREADAEEWDGLSATLEPRNVAFLLWDRHRGE